MSGRPFAGVACALLFLVHAHAQAQAQAMSLTDIVREEKAALTSYEAGDYESAYARFLTLAQAGSSVAQHNLGVMLALGQGVGQNAIEASAWLGLAVHGSEQAAPGLREQLLAVLTPEDQTAANARTRSLIDELGDNANTRRLMRQRARQRERAQDMAARFGRARDASSGDMVMRTSGRGVCGSAREGAKIACFSRRSLGLGLVYAQRKQVFTTLSNDGFTRTSVPKVEIPETMVIIHELRLLPVIDDEGQPEQEQGND